MRSGERGGLRQAQRDFAAASRIDTTSGKEYPLAKREVGLASTTLSDAAAKGDHGILTSQTTPRPEVRMSPALRDASRAIQFDLLLTIFGA